MPIIAPEPRPEKTLPAIREALSHPRDREGFDWGLPAAVEEARAVGDWKSMEDFTHRWWIIACDSMQHGVSVAIAENPTDIGLTCMDRAWPAVS
ncbi:DUF6247 family protein [Streptosporangium sp. CA-115845]|uniref:DUF6247 family protein n=1 Tax=Streptosporangium sp. CA-115845 TaxID=3240071 RepID=UPI003D8DAAE9